MAEQTEKPRISHIALKVTDLDATAGFYKDVFGFTEIARHHDGDHVSLHLTDGYLDLALVKYKSEESVIGQIAGTETCIHHFGIDVPDVDGYKKTLESWGADVFNDPTTPDIPVWKFRVPGGGGIGEIGPFKWHSPKGKYKV